MPFVIVCILSYHNSFANFMYSENLGFIEASHHDIIILFSYQFLIQFRICFFIESSLGKVQS